MFKRAALVASLLIASVVVHSPLATAPRQRNPLCVPDVIAADRPRSRRAHAQRTAMVAFHETGQRRYVRRWYSRAETGTFGNANIRVFGDRLFAPYTDQVGRLSGKTWLLQAVVGNDKSPSGRWIKIWQFQ